MPVIDSEPSVCWKEIKNWSQAKLIIKIRKGMPRTTRPNNYSQACLRRESISRQISTLTCAFIRQPKPKDINNSTACKCHWKSCKIVDTENPEVTPHSENIKRVKSSLRVMTSNRIMKISGTINQPHRRPALRLNLSRVWANLSMVFCWSRHQF